MAYFYLLLGIGKKVGTPEGYVAGIRECRGTFSIGRERVRELFISQDLLWPPEKSGRNGAASVVSQRLLMMSIQGTQSINTTMRRQ